MANKVQLKRSAVPGKVPATTDLDLGEIAINTYDGKAYIKKNVSGTESIVPLGGAGSGDVTGPNSSTDNAIARFDGASGKIIQNSTVVIDDSGNVGIGAASPVKKLTTIGDIGIGYNNALCFTDGGSGTFTADKAIYNYWDGGADRLQIQPSGSSGGIITFHAGAPATTRTERMRIDASGNVLLNASTAKSYSNNVVTPKLQIQSTGTDGALSTTRFTAALEAPSRLILARSGSATLGTDAVVAQGTSLGSLSFQGYDGVGYVERANVVGVVDGAVSSGTLPSALVFNTGTTASIERMRITSGGVVGIGPYATTNTSAGVSIVPDNGGGVGYINVSHTSQDTGGNLYLSFVRNAVAVGSITSSGTNNVAYNTSSDYRLKENIQPMQNALAVVQQLNPVTYTWKADGSDGQGFIAHELQAVVPDCVTGEKDAVDSEGNPVYQGVDTSFLVATLTAAIKELKAELDATKAEVAALKAQINQGA